VIGVKQAVGREVSDALPTDRPEFLVAWNLVRFPGLSKKFLNKTN
jgi:hypothetical protein